MNEGSDRKQVHTDYMKGSKSFVSVTDAAVYARDGYPFLPRAF